MSLMDDLARAREARPQPVLVDVAIGDVLYKVEARRLDGMEWAAIMAEAPPEDAASARIGYAVQRATELVCKRHGRLLDGEGEPVAEVDWDAVLNAISGVEFQAVGATWWALNMGDPNQRVVALKKASAGGSATKSNSL